MFEKLPVCQTDPISADHFICKVTGRAITLSRCGEREVIIFGVQKISEIDISTLKNPRQLPE
jgi:hypothetical protein